MNSQDTPPPGVVPTDEPQPTHVVVAFSRTWAWVRPFDVATGLAVPSAQPAVLLKMRPGIQCVTGDRVVVADDCVQAVLPRQRTLTRSHRGQEQLLGAHLDRVVVVVAVGRAMREGFVMRAVVACSVQGLPFFVVLNKMDLDDDGEGAARAQSWRSLGLRVLTTSVVTGAGLDELGAELDRGATALLGFSGVGKSTLLNALRPNAGRKTGGLDWQGKGKHITSMAEAIVAPGSMIVDLPGVRELGLSQVTRDDIMTAFPDVRDAMANCRYATCTHGDDEGCGVRAAIESGSLNERRVALCLRIIDSVAMGTEGGGRI